MLWRPLKSSFIPPQNPGVSGFCALLLLFTPASLFADPAPKCDPDLLKAISKPSGFSPALQQWLDWETTPALRGLDPEFKSSQVPITLVNRSLVDVRAVGALPSEVEKLFLHDSKVLWAKHPYNRRKDVPFFNFPVLQETLTGYHTASRSMVFSFDGKAFGIKMPTDHPFGPGRAEQANKAYPKDSMLSSMRRAKIIEQVDQKLGADPDLILLRDILTITDKKTGNGIAIRDLRALQDGNLYFPAHLIPVAGEDLAKKNGAGFSEFFKTAWARPLGVIQAKLLIRYGMEYNPINPQNFLIQLDANFKPTGKLACRDLGDIFQVETVSRRIGLGPEVDADISLGLKTFKTAAPAEKSETLTWGFNLSGKNLLLPVTRQAWLDAHDEGLTGEIERLLNVKYPKTQGTYIMEKFLERPEIQEALARFHRLPK